MHPVTSAKDPASDQSVRLFVAGRTPQNLLRTCMQASVRFLGADKSCTYSAHLKTDSPCACHARLGISGVWPERCLEH